MQLYKQLFIRKEFGSILGRGYSNFWILMAVFVITLFALAFSRSGLQYLDYKMNDPFINWVQIKTPPSNFAQKVEALKDTFGISVFEENAHIFECVFNRAMDKQMVEGRSIAFDSQLHSRILGGENVVRKSKADIDDHSIGWIVTEDLMKKLGYAEPAEYPMFVSYAFPGDAANIKACGISDSEGFVQVPIPITAVVKQLPDLLDFIAPMAFETNNTRGIDNPFNITMHKKYYNDLYIVTNDDADEVLQELRKEGLSVDDSPQTEDFDKSIAPSLIHRFVLRDTVIADINRAVGSVLEKHPQWDRYYGYEIADCDPLNKNYMSLMFTDLNKVPAFADWAKEHRVRIDMAQIEAKKNFEVFSSLATTLCWLIAIIAIGFVVIFVYFLVDSHFRRISKNLGTIMAFGLSNTDIIGIYLPVFMGLILSSLLSASVVIAIAEFAFKALGIVREGGFMYFALEDVFIALFVLLLLAVSAVVTSLFLGHKLKATPGDLIFERND